jgi:hypothetical protein
MRQIFFIRHGKADKQAEGQPDISRALNDIGIGQATARGEKLKHVKFDQVLSSPAPRARKTAALVTGKPEDEIVTVEVLYPDPNDGGIGTSLDSVLNRIGYAPVSSYLKDAEGKEIMDWAYDAFAMSDVAIGNGNPEVVAIFGHAVCLPALGMVFCEGTLLTKTIEDFNLGECEGFVISFGSNGTPYAVEQIRD